MASKHTAHNGPHGDARKAITKKNKARREKQYAKWLSKRREKNAGKPKKPSKGGDNRVTMVDPSSWTIRFRDQADGKISQIDGLRINGYTETQTDDGQVTTIQFLTKANKPWTVGFGEFSFVIPPAK